MQDSKGFSVFVSIHANKSKTTRDGSRGFRQKKNTPYEVFTIVDAPSGRIRKGCGRI